MIDGKEFPFNQGESVSWNTSPAKRDEKLKKVSILFDELRNLKCFTLNVKWRRHVRGILQAQYDACLAKQEEGSNDPGTVLFSDCTEEICLHDCAIALLGKVMDRT